MLKLARVTSRDVLFDLGSGDGRIAIAAASAHGARAVGIELDADLVRRSVEAARQQRVDDLVTFLHGDLFSCDLRDATVAIVYLLPSLNRQLRPKLLRELRPGARVISHAFDMDGWAPDARVDVDGRPLFRWTVPGQGTRLVKPASL